MSATSRKPKEDNEDREARRREILDAAFNEFVARGYAGASMEAIARQARASKETLYAWFGNKEQLFDTLLQSRLDGLTSQYDAGALKTEPPPELVLQTVAEDVLRFHLAIEPLSRAIGADAHGAKARRNAARIIGEERKKFAAYMLKWKTKGLIAFDDDPLEIVSLFVAMAQGEWSFRLATGMIDGLSDKMIKDHARRVTRTFLKGLAPERKKR
ncbi:MAG TPA: TetR/AcrR family transcriptional regulator [Hyphomonadaceae bacterium]|nr:TetR/AcrR family transcriptional regulator [Hyphomonadaceae bacterium]